MKRTHDLRTLLSRAHAEGLLPEGVALAQEEHRPWPVLVLTALGAWLAVVPLLAFVAALLGSVLLRGPAPYIVGVLVLAGAVRLLRAKDLPLFVEQLALPALVVGGGCLAMGLYKDLPQEAASACLAALAVGLSALVGRTWISVLLGALAACLLGAALNPLRFFSGRSDSYLPAFWVALHVLLLAWLAALCLQRTLPPKQAQWVESLQAGWLMPVLVGLAYFSGMTLLVGAAFAGGDWGRMGGALWRARGGSAWWAYGAPAVSALMVLGSALWLARAWPSLRRWPLALAVLALMALAAFLPALGGVLLAMGVLAVSRRWVMGGAAALAAAWVVGAFYYQLSLPLATKAIVLAGVAAVLAAAAWALRRTGAPVASAAALAPENLAVGMPRHKAWLFGGALLALGVANAAIWQKQQLIAHGQALFVALAPVDPRSLMQGDYMRLAYQLPDGLFNLAPPGVAQTAPHVVAKRDARGVAQMLRLGDDGQALAEGEFRLRLIAKGGSWVLVSDAWFFKEGDADRWAAARYGEFRVLPDGRALLVGLANAQLQRIEP